MVYSVSVSDCILFENSILSLLVFDSGVLNIKKRRGSWGEVEPLLYDIVSWGLRLGMGLSLTLTAKALPRFCGAEWRKLLSLVLSHSVIVSVLPLVTLGNIHFYSRAFNMLMP